ncbi:hypothetical protein BH23ACT2_BH23ACT2_07680 [soil metagenome]
MINFRYHIVSITAVFLALGIGVALGSTFLDGPTVDLLNRNIRGAEARIDATELENSRLARENMRSEERDVSLINEAGERLVGPYLTDEPVLVVVGPGVDNAVANDLREFLGSTGADLRGTLVLNDQLALDDEFDADLADALDIETSSIRTLRASVYEELEAALLAAGAPPVEEVPTDDGDATEGDADQPETEVDDPPDADDPPDGDGADPNAEEGGDPAPLPTDPDTTEADPTTEPEGFGVDESIDDGASATPDGTQPDVVSILADRGYLAIEAGGDDTTGGPILETTGYRYVFVTDVDITGSEAEAMGRLLPAGSPDETLPVVVVSPRAPEPTEGEEEEVPTPSLVERIRTDDQLRGLYDTVDDIDAFSGLVATVLVLEDLEEAPPGHYGQGPEAQAVLPPAP